MEAEDEEAEIDAEDIVEVIDLDEGDDEEPLDEDEDDGAVGSSSRFASTTSPMACACFATQSIKKGELVYFTTKQNRLD